MKTLIVLLVVCFIHNTLCGETEHNIDNKLEKTISTVANMMGSPEVAMAIETLKALRTESTTTIGQRHDQIGFKMLNNGADFGLGLVAIENLNLLINEWLNDDVFTFLDPKYKKILSNAVKEYSLQIKTETFIKQTYRLSFNDGKGNLFMLMLMFDPHPTQPNALKWKKFLLWSSFEPTPPYVIVTHSDCNIFFCDRSDEIVYLPTVFTDAHMQSLVNIHINMMFEFGKNLDNLRIGSNKNSLMN